MVTRIAIMLGVMLASVAWGQTLHQTDQNVFDLNPERDALTGLSGSQRIRADFYGDPGFTDSYDLSQSLPLTLTITTTQDAWTVTSTSVSNVPPNRVYWSFSVGVGVYRLQSTAYLPGDSPPVFDRYLVVTSTPPAADTTVNVSATVTSVLQGAATISLVPLQSNVGVIGTSDLPWGEFHAGTGTFSRLTVSETLEVSDAIQAADTGAVKLVGSIMTGPLTNEAGFFGDGAGLTNLTVAGDGNETNATGIGVVLTPTNYTLSTPDVEAALIGIDQAFAASGGGGSDGTGPFQIVNTESIISTNSGHSINAGSDYSAMIGGQNGTISGAIDFSGMIGGNGNSIGTSAGNYSFMAGGVGSTLNANYSAIIGGNAHNATDVPDGYLGIFVGRSSKIAAGGSYSVILGGYQQYNGGRAGLVGGGYWNTNAVGADYSAIIGSYKSRNTAKHAGIFGAHSGNNSGTNSVIIGGIGPTNTTPNSALIMNNIKIMVSTNGVAPTAGMMSFQDGSLFFCKTNGVWSEL